MTPAPWRGPHLRDRAALAAFLWRVRVGTLAHGNRAYPGRVVTIVRAGRHD